MSIYFRAEISEALLSDHDRKGSGDSELVANPLWEASQRIFLSSMLQPDQSLDQQILSAVERKAMKAHTGKDMTVLIIDNRTSAFDLRDYRSAAEKLAPMFAELPFPEIWFYTGYCSDNDGNNAEFSFAPLKITCARTPHDC